MQATHQPPILVAACGNRSAGDDAFGPLVADRLRELHHPALNVVDLGMKPAGLVDHLAGQLGLIVVDAVLLAADAESELIDMEFGADDRPPLVHDVALSSHGLSIEHELKLAEVLGLLPSRIHLVGARASQTEVGLPASRIVLGCIEPATERIVRLAESWLRALSVDSATR